MTLGATLLMTLTLAMISISLLISFAIKDTSNKISSKINLSIYFRDDAITDDKIIAFGEELKKIEEVAEVQFINKDKALEIWRRFPINQEIKDPVSQDFNPLPRSLEVRTDNPDDIEPTAASISQADTNKLICGDCLSYGKNKEVVDRLVAGTRTAQQAGWLLSVIFGLIAVLNVFNIIRLTIITRSDEIEIMRYVGASNSFIRGPFIIEGIFYGLFATVITTILVPLLAYLVSQFGSSSNLGVVSIAFQLLDANLYQYVLNHLTTLVIVQLAVGVLAGVIVSLISIRRYLSA